FDSVSCEQFEEFFKGPRRVTDGPDHEVRISTTIHGFLLSFVLGNMSGPTGSSKQGIAMAASGKHQSATFVVESQMRECHRPLCRLRLVVDGAVRRPSCLAYVRSGPGVGNGKGRDREPRPRGDGGRGRYLVVPEFQSISPWVWVRPDLNRSRQHPKLVGFPVG